VRIARMTFQLASDKLEGGLRFHPSLCRSPEVLLRHHPFVDFVVREVYDPEVWFRVREFENHILEFLDKVEDDRPGSGIT
jgi:hypothetical protein